MQITDIGGCKRYKTSVEIQYNLQESLYECISRGLSVSDIVAILETDDEILLISGCDFQDLLISNICTCKKGILHVQSDACVAIYNNKYRFHKDGTIEVWLNTTVDDSTFYFRRP